MAPPPGLRLSGTAARAAAWAARFQAVPAFPTGLPLLLLLAATDTAAVEGISAAGATAASRRRTAAADAELLLLGPAGPRPHALPPLPAGVSPALISHVVAAELALAPLVVDLGCAVAPAVPHLRLGSAAGGGGPAACLSSGAALPPARVERLVALGRRWGEGWRRQRGEAPLLLAECVPGGTSTALAVLLGLGVEAEGLVSGSLLRPAHGLKAALAARGLAAAGLGTGGARSGLAAGPGEPLAVLAAVGDPMQALAAGLVAAAGAAGVPLLLAGGSQMAAVLALALALTPRPQRPALLAHSAVVTTAWVAGEPDSDLARLLARIGDRFLPGAAAPLGLASGLRFDGCRSGALRDYERGYVKEGVGAGGLALLWELSGRSPVALAAACDRACAALGAP